MAKKNTLQSVRIIHSSNVGADQDTKTLWVIGAGASRHLQFPLSFDLFSKSVKICAAKLKTFAAKSEASQYSYLKIDLKNRGINVPSRKELKALKDDAVLALTYIDAWIFLKPERDTFIPIQELFNMWTSVFEKLKRVGIELTPKQLLEKYPEELIDQIRKTKPKPLVEASLAYDLDQARRYIADAQKVVSQIYFFTLSRFNDDAREQVRKNVSQSLYTQLVLSFILEKNARIITFNYDTILDEAIFSHFTRSWKYGGMSIAGINGYPVSSGSKADLILIKPHGSLNYLICGNCKRAHVNWFWTYRQTGANQFASRNRRCTVCTEAMPGRTELMKSLTVAPLYDKKIIKRSHKAMSEAFRWADHVVSIGYSFPCQDTYVFDLLTKAIKSRKGSKLSVAIVSHNVESAKTIAARLRTQLKKREVTAKMIAVKAMKLEGFEAVRTGTENIPVKL